MLLAEGQPFAKKYTIGLLRYEAYLARERQNNILATEAILIDAVICKALSPKKSKEAANHLKKLLRKLQNG